MKVTGKALMALHAFNDRKSDDDLLRGVYCDHGSLYSTDGKRIAKLEVAGRLGLMDESFRISDDLFGRLKASDSVEIGADGCSIGKWAIPHDPYDGSVDFDRLLEVPDEELDPSEDGLIIKPEYLEDVCALAVAIGGELTVEEHARRLVARAQSRAKGHEAHVTMLVMGMVM